MYNMTMAKVASSLLKSNIIRTQHTATHLDCKFAIKLRLPCISADIARVPYTYLHCANAIFIHYVVHLCALRASNEANHNLSRTPARSALAMASAECGDSHWDVRIGRRGEHKKDTNQRQLAGERCAQFRLWPLIAGAEYLFDQIDDFQFVCKRC